MNTTADKINLLENTKTAIKESIESLGANLKDVPFSSYPSHLDGVYKLGNVELITGQSNVLNTLVKRIDITGLLKGHTNLDWWFSDMSNVIEIAGADTVNTSSVTSISGMCTRANAKVLQAVKNWNTSNVTNMSAVFSRCNIPENYTLNWNTGKVTNTANMFQDCTVNGTLDLSHLNFNNVTDANGMLKFKQPEKTVSNPHGFVDVILPDNCFPKAQYLSIYYVNTGYLAKKLAHRSKNPNGSYASLIVDHDSYVSWSFGFLNGWKLIDGDAK